MGGSTETIYAGLSDGWEKAYMADTRALYV